MIVGSLKDTERYEDIHPLFKTVFDFLRNTDFLKSEVGTIELQGKDAFAIISDSDLRNKELAKPEAHNRYLDIQLPISKAETFGWKYRLDLNEECEPFNDERDIQFFEDKVETYFSVSPGDFVIFFPEDGHAPCIGEGKIRKVVVKIKI
ncbi:YhcH/YjgK/YiaL family protein [Dysgonomonas sp. ZJ709]|uniref:YhcH/YjgK/YiaL family protein n=1 Tax=Dysgonomonas sp. ZJ709 TaxID=2709797 RepID=UPI0013E99EEB|nr:YhcH/YjgK/YiaL family protein [Dysgonomonas sp. ZJ709]